MFDFALCSLISFNSRSWQYFVSVQACKVKMKLDNTHSSTAWGLASTGGGGDAEKTIVQCDCHHFHSFPFIFIIIIFAQKFLTTVQKRGGFFCVWYLCSFTVAIVMWMLYTVPNVIPSVWSMVHTVSCYPVSGFACMLMALMCVHTNGAWHLWSVVPALIFMSYSSTK